MNRKNLSRLSRPSFRPAVEALEERRVPATFLVTNANDSGANSLRQAILDANSTSGADTITFSISGAGLHTINVGGTTGQPLPTVTDALFIDGWSQRPGGTAGAPLIELNGTSAGANANGLVFNAADCTVRGLIINRFTASGITFNGDRGTAVGNYVGTDSTGLLDRGNGGIGVALNSSHNTLGGATATARNLISGNDQQGVVINGGFNTVQGNYVGLGSDGKTALGNALTGLLIQLSGGVSNTIGGTASGAGNVISSNGTNGVLIQVGPLGNLLQGNFIGTDATGTLDRGNGGNGVTITSTVGVQTQPTEGNEVGGTAAGAGNVISGNGGFGVQVTGSAAIGNRVRGNVIGLNAAGTAALKNDSGGVQISSLASGNFVGGTTAAERNVISNNGGQAGVILDSGATLNVISGNYIGTDKNGTKDLGNAGDGVLLNGVADNVVGGAVSGAGNLISGNDGDGVSISGAGATGNQVQGNVIGLDANGAVLANAGNGVFLDGAPANLVGGTASGAGNVISGNDGSGVLVNGTGAAGNVIQGNTIGLDAAKDNPKGNTFSGIAVQDAPGTLIGGTATNARNVISANGSNGVFVSGTAASGTTIQNNVVGLDGTGTKRRGNGDNGVLIISAPGNLIGGTAAGAGNVISGNVNGQVNEGGVSISQSSDNVVQGNLIGTDVTGTVNLGNGSNGVVIGTGSTGNLVGGGSTAARNVISGNGFGAQGPGAGVLLIDFGTGVSRGNSVQGNLIGTDKNGTAALGNALGGVVIFDGPTDNLIGGPLAGQGNVIAGSVGVGSPPADFGDGVIVLNANGNTVQNNRVGTNADGTAPLGNFGNGVRLETAHDNTVIDNLLSGNGANGVLVQGGGGNRIHGNLIGTDVTGGSDLGNTAGGVELQDTSDNTVGGLTTDDRNVISGNGDANNNANGVLITGATSTGNVVVGNFIGTDAAGAAVLANSFNGVLIDGAPDNTIGGDSPEARNVISGNGPTGFIINTGTGVVIQGSTATGNVVRGNYIGTDVTGAVAVPNGGGVLVAQAGAGNIIGGPLAGQRNLISGNTGPGVTVAGGGGLVEGNWIGLDADGTAALGNGTDGVFLNQAVNAEVQGNVVSGNANNGVNVNTGSTGSLVAGNLVGTNPAGTAAIGNGFNGVLIDLAAVHTTIGGTTAADRNVISGNQYGVRIINPGTNDNVVEGNFIGTDVSGALAVPNTADGVFVSAPGPVTGNVIGGTAAGAGNTIAFNGGNGVTVTGVIGNPILGNSIFANAGLGINLAAGGNANEAAPVLTSAVAGPAGVIVRGVVRGTPNHQLLIQFFANPAGPAGPAQGRTFVGSVVVTANGRGVASISAVVPAVAGQPFLTATATDLTANDTSRFSAARQVIPPPVLAARAGGGTVAVSDARTGQLLFRLQPYGPAYHGSLRVATGDVTGDGIPDVIVAAGPGPRRPVRVFDGASHGLLSSFFASPPGFAGGLFVAAGDVLGDSAAEVIVGLGAGGGRVLVYSGQGRLLRVRLPFGSNFRGGVQVLAGDVDHDGRAEIIAWSASGPSRLTVLK